jgi:hypothetical protein
LRRTQIQGITVYEGLNHRKPWKHFDLAAGHSPVDLIASFHEQAHWIQFCGTSIGALLTAIRLYQHLWVRDYLPYVSPVVRDELFEHRRRGKPIFAVDRDNGLVLDHLSDDGREMAHTWWEYEVAYAFLRGTLGTPELLKHDRADVIGGVLGFIGHVAIGGKLPDDRDLLVALMRAFATPEWNWLDTAKCEVTTEDLLEAGAVVDELATLAAGRAAGINDRALRNRHRKRIEEILTHRYFAAVRIFCRQVGLSDPLVIAEDEDVQRGFLAIVDLALNPPVPPFISRVAAERIASGPPGVISVKQLYPPLRFRSLCLALRALLQRRRADFPADDAETFELEQRLCYVAQLVGPWELPEPWPAHETRDFTLLEEDQSELATLSLSRYFSTVHQQLWRLRSAHPGFSTRHVDAITLDRDPDRSNQLLLSHYGGIVQPLVQMGRFTKGLYTLLPAPGLERLREVILTRSALEYLLVDIFGNVGPLSLDPFPAALAKSASVREGLLAAYAQQFGVDPGLALTHEGRRIRRKKA